MERYPKDEVQVVREQKAGWRGGQGLPAPLHSSLLLLSLPILCYLIFNYIAFWQTQLGTSYHCLTADRSREDALQLEDDGQCVVIGQPELQAAAKTQRLWERRRWWAALMEKQQLSGNARRRAAVIAGKVPHEVDLFPKNVADLFYPSKSPKIK